MASRFYFSSLFVFSLLQKPQECLRNRNTIMLIGDTIDAVVVYVIAQDAAVFAQLEDLPHHFLCEFGVSLHRNDSPGHVHGLVGADVGPCKLGHAWWKRKYGIAMHLMD